MKLEGKTALVTGAARGIGRGIAEVFAEEGADVAINDINITCGAANDLVSWVRSRGRRSMAVQADVSERAGVESMFEKVWNEFGPIDILVNNAGIETIVPFLEITDEQWTRVTDVDQRAPVALFAGLLPTCDCRRPQGQHRQYRFRPGGQDSSRANSLRPGKVGHRGTYPQYLRRDDASGHTRELRPSRLHRD